MSKKSRLTKKKPSPKKSSKANRTHEGTAADPIPLADVLANPSAHRGRIWMSAEPAFSHYEKSVESWQMRLGFTASGNYVMGYAGSLTSTGDMKYESAGLWAAALVAARVNKGDTRPILIFGDLSGPLTPPGSPGFSLQFGLIHLYEMAAGGDHFIFRDQ